MKSFFLSQAAEQDIDNIVMYLASLNPHSALQLLDAAYKAMDMLAENPMLGHLREDLTELPVRF